MTDIKLDLDGGSANLNDVVLEGGDLVLVSGTQAILQNALQRLRTFFGEWFLDNTLGVPYFQEILVKNPDQGQVDALLLNTILGTQGIETVSNYSFEPDFIDRQLTVTFRAITTEGTVDYTGTVVA